jgi:hypothetical protein
MKKDETVDGIPVNDGGGLLDNFGLIDSLILDCNESVKAIATGNYISFCNRIVDMVKKLSNLKDGIKTELDSKDEQIRQLHRFANDILEDKTGLPVDRSNEKDGE